MALRNSLRNSLQDLRYAVRQLRRAPGFAFTLVLTLALSVGVATAVFCVIDTVILRPLPLRIRSESFPWNPTAAAGMFSRIRDPATWMCAPK
jgi:hypothetical protein